MIKYERTNIDDVSTKRNNVLSIESFSDPIKSGYMNQLDFLQNQLLKTTVDEKIHTFTSQNSDLPVNSCLNQNFSDIKSSFKEESMLGSTKCVIPPPGFFLTTESSLKPQFATSSSSSSSNFSSVNNSSPSTPSTSNGIIANRGTCQAETNIFSKNLHNTLKSILPNANISFGYNNGNNSTIANNNYVNSNNLNSLPNLNNKNELCWPDDPAIISSFTENSLLNGINTGLKNLIHDYVSDSSTHQTIQSEQNSVKMNNHIHSNDLNDNFNSSNNRNFLNNAIKTSEQSLKNNTSSLKTGNNLTSFYSQNQSNNVKVDEIEPNHHNLYSANPALLQHFQILTNIYQSKNLAK